MATVFIPTEARNLRRGDLLWHYDERVSVTPRPCDVHPGGLYFAVEGFDSSGRYNGTHSDVCCDPEMLFVVRRPA